MFFRVVFRRVREGGYKCAFFLRNSSVRPIYYYRYAASINGSGRLYVFYRLVWVFHVAVCVIVVRYHFGLVGRARQE